MAETTRRRGMHPIVAFILGIIFGIILLVGTIGAAIYIALTYNLDKIDANKDSDGNYIYVNADTESGGVSNALELFSKVSSFATNYQSLSIGEVENLLPITTSVTSTILDAFGKYVELDEDTIKSKPVMELGEYLQDVVMDIRVAALMEQFGGSLNDNELLSLVINGTEAETVDSGTEKIPLSYDVYTLDSDGNYTLNGKTLSAELSSCIVEKNGENRLYFYEYPEGNYYATAKIDDQFVFTANIENSQSLAYNSYYSADTAKLSGNYYYDINNTKVDLNPITIRSLTDGTAMENLDNIYVTELLENSENDLTQEVLGDITLGDLINGRVDFEEKVNNLEITVLLDVEPTNAIMAYLGYGVTGLYQDENGNWFGEVKFDDETYACTIATEDKNGTTVISSVTFVDNDGITLEVPATTVNGISDRVGKVTDELAISDIMDIEPPTAEESNSIMIFLAFSATDLVESVDTPYAYVATYNYQEKNSETGETEDKTVLCYVYVENGKITRVEAADGVKAEKTTIGGVSAQVNRLTKTLKLKNIITVEDDDKVMKKLGEHTISNVSNAIDELTLDDFITIDLTTLNSTSAIMSYMVYGVSDIEKLSGNIGGIEYSYVGIYNLNTVDADGKTVKEKIPCYIIVDGENKILTAFTYANDEQTVISGTPVKGVSDRVSGLTADLAIGQIMEIDESNKILHALKNSTIDELPTAINNLAINELYSDTIYKADNNSTTELYLATNTTTISQATEYNEKYVYYTFSDGVYSLAGTTGKLSESEYDGYTNDNTLLFTLGEKDGKYLIKYDERFVYYTYVEDEAKIYGNLSASDFEEDTYYTYGSPNAVWKLLLYTTAEGESVSKESVISVNDITKLVNNVTANIKKTTMRELVEAGIVDISENDLDLQITYMKKSDKNPTGYEAVKSEKTMGEMTLTELINLIIDIAKAL